MTGRMLGDPWAGFWVLLAPTAVALLFALLAVTLRPACGRTSQSDVPDGVRDATGPLDPVNSGG